MGRRPVGPKVGRKVCAATVGPMSTWNEKIEKNVGADIQDGETLLAGLLLHPPRTAGRSMARGIGGAAAQVAIRQSAQEPDVDPDLGFAATLPPGTMVVGITDKRFLVWGWTQLTGKPKTLLCELPIAELEAVETTAQKASTRVVLRFADEGGTAREAPKIGNNIDSFINAWESTR